MASVRKRRGQWAVVWRDGTRAQHASFFGTGNDAREAADAYLAKVIPQARQKRRPVVDPKITIATYGQRWLDQVEALVQAGERKPRTLEHYDDMLRLHIEPQLGTLPVRELGRGDVKELLLTKLRSGLDAGTVNIIYRTLRAMLSAAVDDEVIPANPIAKLGRALGLSPSKAARQEAVKSKAMTRAQLITFLSTVFTRERRWYPLLLTLARTGLRLGEGLALQIGLHDDGGSRFPESRDHRRAHPLRQWSPGGHPEDGRKPHRRHVAATRRDAPRAGGRGTSRGARGGGPGRATPLALSRAHRRPTRSP